MIQNLFLLARLAFLVDIFGMPNVLNITLQGCGIDTSDFQIYIIQTKT